MPKPKPATTPQPTKRETRERAYELMMTIRPEADALNLRNLSEGLPVTLAIGDSIRLVGKVSHVHVSEYGVGIGFALHGDDQTAPLSSAAIRAWFADAVGALLACEDTPNDVANALTEALTNIGNSCGAYEMDSALARHILRRSFLVAEAESDRHNGVQ